MSTLSRLARVVAILGAMLQHATASVVGGSGALWARRLAGGHRRASARLLGSGLVCAVAAIMTFGAATATAAKPAATIDSESAGNVTDTAASMMAEINPHGSRTTYQFQYGTNTSYSSGSVPATPAGIGAGAADVAVRADLTGLAPGTLYHFRVVASNLGGIAPGPDKTFKTYPSGLPTGLPDGRGYEMVTPSDKDSGEPYFRFDSIEFHAAAVDGNRMAYLSFDAFAGSVFDGSFYESTRASSDWTTQNLIPPQSTETGLLCATGGPQMVGYSADLSHGILEDGGGLIGACGEDQPALVPGEPRHVQNLFVRDNDTGTYQLVNVTPSGVKAAAAHLDAASADMSHVVFDESAELTANAPSGDDLYEWTGGAVRLVTILPSGKSVVGTIADGEAGNAFNAVSADGSEIFFTAAPTANATTNLYVRENGASTVQIDKPQGGSGPGGGGQFLAASTDGSVVYFTDDASAGLTSDTVANSGTNLYAYSLSSGTLTDLTPVADPEVAGLSGISDDGTYVYFVADGQLAAGAAANQPNLYLLHGGTTTFIATLNSSDTNDWSPTSLSARVSDNGQFIVFDSIDPLTHYDNNDVNTGSPDDEIFVYQAGGSKPACVSCIPSGVQPSSGASIYPPTATPITGVSYEVLQRFVSDTGQVFFDTTDKLLPTVNGGTRNVYEYEGGQVRLLSSGHSPDDSLFLDSTPDGSNVFFATTDQLVPQDTDDGYDIYDARVGGGFPFSTPPPACVGDGCKPAETAPPAAPVVATVVFFGPGNPTSSTPPAAPKPLAKVTAKTKALKGFRFAINVTIPARESSRSRAPVSTRRTSRSARGPTS